MIQAVLTGDIVNSTMLNEAMEKKLANSLRELFTDHKMEFFRGDSFQAYIKEPKQALRLALMARAIAVSLSRDENSFSTDVRISIGLGQVSIPVRSLKTARGEAFILSGRRFDNISKTEQRLAIAVSNPLADEGMQVIADYINAIFDGMTGKQAEVILELLKGEMQKAVARKLKKTKSTIHQRMTAGRWPELEKLLQRYENIINLLV
jgi:hypothetical protein